MIKFNLILKAAQRPVTPKGFLRLCLGTAVMLAFGYAGGLILFTLVAAAQYMYMREYGCRG